MNCNVIKDLLSLYIDGFCSKDTIEIVEEHLEYAKDVRHI